MQKDKKYFCKFRLKKTKDLIKTKVLLKLKLTIKTKEKKSKDK